MDVNPDDREAAHEAMDEIELRKTLIKRSPIQIDEYLFVSQAQQATNNAILGGEHINERKLGHCDVAITFRPAEWVGFVERQVYQGRKIEEQ